MGNKVHKMLKIDKAKYLIKWAHRSLLYYPLVSTPEIFHFFLKSGGWVRKAQNAWRLLHWWRERWWRLHGAGAGVFVLVNVVWFCFVLNNYMNAGAG